MGKKLFVALALVIITLMFFVIQKTDIRYAKVFAFLYPKPVPLLLTSENRDNYTLIAHAAGAVDGKIYTNSQEALEQAIHNGFTLIELDLRETCDGKIVAVHSWEDFYIMAGRPASKECSSLQELRSQKLFGAYSPLTAKEITDIFLQNPHLVLVTDKIKNYEQLLLQIPIDRNRFFVEVFSFKQYQKALKAGITYPMLCIWDVNSFAKYQPLMEAQRIVMITLPVGLLPKLQDQLKSLHEKGLIIFAFTSDDENFITLTAHSYVTGFYTNFITPADIR